MQDFSDITRTEPEKSLIIARKEFAGRTGGKITVRHKGGGETISPVKARNRGLAFIPCSYPFLIRI